MITFTIGTHTVSLYEIRDSLTGETHTFMVSQGGARSALKYAETVAEAYGWETYSVSEIIPPRVADGVRVENGGRDFLGVFYTEQVFRDVTIGGR